MSDSSSWSDDSSSDEESRARGDAAAKRMLGQNWEQDFDRQTQQTVQGIKQGEYKVGDDILVDGWMQRREDYQSAVGNNPEAMRAYDENAQLQGMKEENSTFWKEYKGTKGMRRKQQQVNKELKAKYPGEHEATRHALGVSEALHYGVTAQDIVKLREANLLQDDPDAYYRDSPGTRKDNDIDSWIDRRFVEWYNSGMKRGALQGSFTIDRGVHNGEVVTEARIQSHAQAKVTAAQATGLDSSQHGVGLFLTLLQRELGMDSV